MPLSFDRDRVVVPDCVVTREVGGTTVLLNVETGRSFRLDETGSQVWKALTSSPSLQGAFDLLLTEFQVEPDQLRLDLEALVEALDAQGLLDVRRA